MKKWNNYLYLITVLFFTLGFINIAFAWMGFVCMIIPFVLLAKSRKKLWCQKYCPRANMFETFFRNRSLTNKPGPAWLTKGKAKWFMLAYFGFNLFVLGMSTFMVFAGNRPPIEKVRFLIAFQFPWNIPQLLDMGQIPGWGVHLAFRVYSMMFTTTVLGMILAWVFKPRTWCTVCPVNTASDLVLKNTKKVA